MILGNIQRRLDAKLQMQKTVAVFNINKQLAATNVATYRIQRASTRETLKTVEEV